jgi:hypothetical protein
VGGGPLAACEPVVIDRDLDKENSLGVLQRFFCIVFIERLLKLVLESVWPTALQHEICLTYLVLDMHYL